MTDDTLVRMAHAQLRGLQNNIPKGTASQEFIDLYHSIVKDLESTGVDLSRFKVPDSSVSDHEWKDSFCDSSYLRTKVDGLLNLFQVSDKKIGFMSLK